MKNKRFLILAAIIGLMQVGSVYGEALDDGLDAGYVVYEETAAGIEENAQAGTDLFVGEDLFTEEPAAAEETQISALSEVNREQTSQTEDASAEELSSGETTELTWEEKAAMISDGTYDEMVDEILQVGAKQEESASGTCGANLKWTFASGTLTITGTGPMSNYGLTSRSPEYEADLPDEIIETNSPFEVLNIRKIVIGNGVTSIGDYAFMNCSNVTSIDIPGSVTSIGVSAFSGCIGLKTVNIAMGLRTIGEGAFENCDGLTTIDLPSSVTTLGPAAFFYCETLRSIYFQGGITKISDWTFFGCRSLKDVYYTGSTSEWNKVTVGENNEPLKSAALHAASADLFSLHRLYNPYSGEHFYTANNEEWTHLVSLGWQYEGIAWQSSTTYGDKAVYRMFNPDPASQEHHYTYDPVEIAHLEKEGWIKEGVAWYSDSRKLVPVYRLFNIRASSPVSSHHYTTDANERRVLISQGWSDEGICWYGGR